MEQYNELALFAGAGGGILGGLLLGWRTVCAVEINPYCASVLAQRQNDGILAPFPIWDDVCTFDGRAWRGIIDVVSGGFPCQDISCAGTGKGIAGERSGLWREMARIIGEVRPQYVLVENSPMLAIRGLGRVLGDLSTMGFGAEWGIISAADVGAWHLRERLWIVAYANHMRQQQSQGRQQNERRWISDGIKEIAYTPCEGLSHWKAKKNQGRQMPERGIKRRVWWSAEPDVVRMVHGVPARVDRIKALGNAQVPAVVRCSVNVLGKQMELF